MVVVYGTVCLDRLHRVPYLPTKGTYVEIAEDVEALGGEAANTALALKRWGLQPVLVGNPIGSGSAADQLARLIDGAGLSRERVPGGPFEAPICEVFVTPDGDRTMMGRGFRQMEERSDPSLIPLEPSGWFTADPNHGRVAREAVRMAIGAGMKCYLMDFVREDDPVPPGGWWQSSSHWLGRRGDSEENQRWLQAWVKRTGANGILTDGGGGFYAGGPRWPVRPYPSFPVGRAVDSTGAGDVFRAGMLFGLSQGWATPDCLRFAAAAGCLNCQALGATPGIPTRREVEALIAANPKVAAGFD